MYDIISQLRCWWFQWASFLDLLLIFHSARVLILLLISGSLLIFPSMKLLSTNNLRHNLYVAIWLIPFASQVVLVIHHCWVINKKTVTHIMFCVMVHMKNPGWERPLEKIMTYKLGHFALSWFPFKIGEEPKGQSLCMMLFNHGFPRLHHFGL